MIELKNLHVSLKENDLEILRSISLSLELGKTYALRGRNGSGKSTLLQTLMGNPQFEVSKGEILIDNKLATNMSETDRSLAGMYLANQYPPEIEGVSFLHFLRLIHNTHHPKDTMPVFAFKERAALLAETIAFPKDLLLRNLNEGFSGGEKKKAEVLQALVIAPKYVMLDELDSGLDSQSIKEVFSGLAVYKKQNPQTCFLIVSHYESVFEYLKPDIEISLKNGTLVE